MSLIDDARRLAERGFTPWEDSYHLTCELCGADFAENGANHSPGCPWLAMPRIVAALEAAQALLDVVDMDEYNSAHRLAEALRDA